MTTGFLLEVLESDGKPRVVVQFASEDALQTFRQNLEESLLKKKEEFRQSLPQGWTLYFKIKPGDTKLLLARPEATEWVGSISFSENLATKFLSALGVLISSKGTLDFSQTLGPVHAFSNFNLVFKF